MDTEDLLNKITKGSIKRLCRRAGIKRLEGLVYPEVRQVILGKLETLVSDALKICSYQKKKTLSVLMVSKVLPINMYTEYLLLGKNIQRKAPKLKTTKSHKFHPGTRALMEIKYYQKTPGLLDRSPIKGLVSALIQDEYAEHKLAGEKNHRMTGGVSVYIQYYIEQYLVELLRDANILAVRTGKRGTVCAQDIRMVRYIRREIDSAPASSS